MRSLQVYRSENKSRANARKEGGKRVQAFCLFVIGLLAVAFAFVLPPFAPGLPLPHAPRPNPSPALTAAFAWLDSLPSRQAALWRVLSGTAAYAGALWLWTGLLYRGPRRSTRFVLIAFGMLFAPFVESVRLEAADSLLLVLLALSFHLRERGHAKWGAFALALSIHLFIVPLLVLFFVGRARRGAYVRFSLLFTLLLAPAAAVLCGPEVYRRYLAQLTLPDAIRAFWTLPGLPAATPYILYAVSTLLLALLAWEGRRLTSRMSKRLSYSLTCLPVLLVLPPFSPVASLAVMPLYLAFVGIFAEKYNDAHAALRIGPAEIWGLSCFFLAIPFAAAEPALSIPLLFMSLIVLIHKLRLTQRRKTAPITDYRLNRSRQQARAK